MPRPEEMIESRFEARQRDLLALVEEAEDSNISQERLVEIVTKDFPSKAWKRWTPGTDPREVFDNFYPNLLNEARLDDRPLSERMIQSFLKNPLIPEGMIALSWRLLSEFWPHLAENPMIPLWFESDQGNFLECVRYYFLFVEHRRTISYSKISFLYLLIHGENKYDKKITSLLEEGIREIGEKKIASLPNSSKKQDWYKYLIQNTSSEDSSLVRYTFQIVTGLRDHHGKGLSDVTLAYDGYSRNILEEMDAKEFKPRLIRYLRWLHKVAKTVGKPMPKHLLSAVFPEDNVDVG